MTLEVMTASLREGRSSYARKASLAQVLVACERAGLEPEQVYVEEIEVCPTIPTEGKV